METVLGCRIVHAGNSREKRLVECILIDGYCAPRTGDQHNGVLQFHGCLWHGCSQFFRINRDQLLYERYEENCSHFRKN